MPRTYRIHRSPGQPITREMRTHIETVCNHNLRLPKKDQLSLRKLAGELNLPRSTLHDEIRRGLVPRPNLCKGKDVRDYSAEIAQRSIDEGQANKGAPMKMTTTVAKLLRIEIVDRHRSPYDALAHLHEQGIPNLPCERSVYYHVHHGDIGSEFLDHAAIEALFRPRGSVRIYYTHAYAAWEKGSVENANRLVRRWYPRTHKNCKTRTRRCARGGPGAKLGMSR